MEVPLISTREDDTDFRSDQVEVEVFADCMVAVEVFRLCFISGVGYGFGVIWLGIDPTQIQSACSALRVKRDDLEDVMRDVVYMGNVVAGSRNEKIKAAAEKR